MTKKIKYIINMGGGATKTVYISEELIKLSLKILERYKEAFKKLAKM